MRNVWALVVFLILFTNLFLNLITAPGGVSKVVLFL